MDWIFPVTDRKYTDACNRTSKGFLNATDLNRIENNSKVIADKLQISITSKTDWAISDIPAISHRKRILSNTSEELEKIMAMYSDNEITDVVPSKLSTYVDFNQLESIQLQIFNLGEQHNWKKSYDNAKVNLIKLDENHQETSNIQYFDTISDAKNALDADKENLYQLIIGNEMNMAMIPQNSFWHCTNLITIEISKNINEIKSYAFSDTGLVSIEIPANVLNIENGVFSNCHSLTSVVFSDSIKNIANALFINCESLTQVVLPEHLMNISDSAFSGCTNLSEIQIPEQVQAIGDMAFYDCKALPELVLPATLRTIGNYAFYRCESLQTLTFPNQIGNVAQYVCFGCKNLAHVALPEHLQNIDNSAFAGCFSLTEITIPEQVTRIGQNAFDECTSLQEIEIPASVTNIGDNAFSRCTSLEKITIHKSKNSISGSPWGADNAEIIWTE